jgi:hypothetical protein
MMVKHAKHEIFLPARPRWHHLHRRSKIHRCANRDTGSVVLHYDQTKKYNEGMDKT